MKQINSASDIPIRSAVIAFQPVLLPRCGRKALPGDVAVLRYLDSRERHFLMVDGACWVDWAKQPECDLIEALRSLKRSMVRDYGIAPHRIEAAFAVIPEYRDR